MVWEWSVLSESIIESIQFWFDWQFYLILLAYVQKINWTQTCEYEILSRFKFCVSEEWVISISKSTLFDDAYLVGSFQLRQVSILQDSIQFWR